LEEFLKFFVCRQERQRDHQRQRRTVKPAASRTAAIPITNEAAAVTTAVTAAANQKGTLNERRK